MSEIEVDETPLLLQILNGLNPKQREFATSQEKYIGMVGGPGKGATSAAIARSILLTLAAQDNPAPVANRGFFGMFEQKRLYQTTIADFMSLLDGMHIPYQVNKMEALLWVPGLRLELYWGAVDEPKKIVNQNLGFAFVEQVECLTPWESFTKLDRRLRFQGVFHSLFFSANAYPKNHWVRHQFPEIGGKIIFSSPRDNAVNLPEDFLKALDGMDPVTRREYEDGELSTLGGLLYPNARRAKHTVPGWPIDRDQPLIRAWDYGRHATLVMQKQDARLVAIKEFMGELNEPLRGYKIRVCEECHQRFGVRKWIDVGDPSQRSRGVTKSESAWEVMTSDPYPLKMQDANNSLDLGHELIRDLMWREDGGIPLLIADPEGCPVLVEGWTYGYISRRAAEGITQREQPVDNDYKHLQDCLRYGACHAFNLRLKKKAMDRIPRTPGEWLGAGIAAAEVYEPEAVTL